MRLNARIAQLEAAAQRQRRVEPCRWHAPVVVYPPRLDCDAHGRVILPPCEAPATCPGPGRARIFLPDRRLS